MKTLVIAILLVAVAAPQAAALTTRDLLATIAMPLAVAAVADVTGVSQDDLATVVSSLNQANVEPLQFDQVMRYVPAALVTDTVQPPQQPFVTYVATQTQQGVTGDALVNAIVELLASRYGVQPQMEVVASAPFVPSPSPQPTTVYVPQPTPQPRVVTTAPVPSTLVVDSNYILGVVRTRIEEVRTHPHGGPPGQLKKIAHVQTGAEIVHGEHPRHEHEHHARVEPQRVIVAQQPPPMYSSAPPPPQRVFVPPGHAKKEGGAFILPGQAKKQEGGGFVPPGHEKKEGDGGEGHGHGKGH